MKDCRPIRAEWKKTLKQSQDNYDPSSKNSVTESYGLS